MRAESLMQIQIPQFNKGVNDRLTIRSNTQRNPSIECGFELKQAISKIGLGGGAYTNPGAGTFQQGPFLRRTVCAVDQCSRISKDGGLSEHLDGAFTQGFHNLFDLSGLLGCMNVKRNPFPRSPSGDFPKLLRVDCPHAVGGDTNPDPRLSTDFRPEGLDIPQSHGQFSIHKPKLTGLDRLFSISGVLINHAEQSQSNSRISSGLNHLLGKFGSPGVGRTTGLVVDIMKFRDLGEARLQHLQKSL